MAADEPIKKILTDHGRILDFKGEELSLQQLQIIMVEVARHRSCQTPMQQPVKAQVSALTKRRLIALALSQLDPNSDQPLGGPTEKPLDENAEYILHLPHVVLDVKFNKILPSGVLVAMDLSDLIFRDGEAVDLRTPQAHVIIENFALNPPRLVGKPKA